MNPQIGNLCPSKSCIAPTRKNLLEKHKIELLHMETKDRLLWENKKEKPNQDLIPDLIEIAGEDAKVELFSIQMKNNEMQRIAKTKTNEFLVTFKENADDHMIVTEVTEKGAPTKVILEYVEDSHYRGNIKLLDLIFRELAKRDPDLIRYKAMEYRADEKP